MLSRALPAASATRIRSLCVPGFSGASVVSTQRSPATFSLGDSPSTCFSPSSSTSRLFASSDGQVPEMTACGSFATSAVKAAGAGGVASTVKAFGQLFVAVLPAASATATATSCGPSFSPAAGRASRQWPLPSVVSSFALPNVKSLSSTFTTRPAASFSGQLPDSSQRPSFNSAPSKVGSAGGVASTVSSPVVASRASRPSTVTMATTSWAPSAGSSARVSVHFPPSAFSAGALPSS